MKRIWICALALLLAACGAKSVEQPSETAGVQSTAWPEEVLERDILYSEKFSDVTARLRGEPGTGMAITLELLREDGTVSQAFDLSAFGGVMAPWG